MDYGSVAQISEKWGISVQRIRYYCRTGRIPGVQQVGRGYLIPLNASRPADLRSKKEKTMDIEKENEYPGTAALITAYEMIPAGILVIAKKENRIFYVYGNKKVEEILEGMNRNSANGQITEQLTDIYPTEKERVYQTLQKAFEFHMETESRFRYWSKTKKCYRWIQMLAKCIDAKEGKTEYLVACIQDVSKEYRTLNELNRKTKLLEKAENNAHVHCMSYDVASQTLYLDNMTKSAYKQKDGILKNYPESSCRPDIICPRDYDVLCRNFEMVRSGAVEDLYFNIRTMSPKGSYTWRRIHLKGIYNKNGKLIKIDGTSIENDSYIRLQEQYAQALEQNAIGSWEYDAKLKKSSTYGITVDIELYDSNQLIAYKYIYPEDRPTVKAMESRLRLGALQQSADIRVCTEKDEQYHMVRFIVTGMCEEDGYTIQKYLCTVKQI